jgi:hypothetical protein
LIERAAVAAERVVRERLRGIAQQWREAVPDARVSEDGDAVVVEARGLKRRWLSEPWLRFAGSLAR